jgi:hypothetical protein
MTDSRIVWSGENENVIFAATLYRKGDIEHTKRSLVDLFTGNDFKDPVNPTFEEYTNLIVYDLDEENLREVGMPDLLEWLVEKSDGKTDYECGVFLRIYESSNNNDNEQFVSIGVGAPMSKYRVRFEPICLEQAEDK